MPTEACRRALHAVSETEPDHPGLALHRYLTEHADAGKGERPEVALLERVAGATASDAFRLAFARWSAALRERPWSLSFAAALTAPLALGLGTESPLEIGVTTHHTYGMPIIPGSALKGLCRRGALRYFQVERAAELSGDPARQFNALFGDTASAGQVIFWDAWYDPSSAQGKPFKRDVITVHHPEYYGRRGEGGAWPTDFDDPNPVPFLVVRPGARFLFAVEAPEGWREFAVRLARWSLENLGAGGKTNAGYGFFRADPSAPPPSPVKEEVWPDCRLTQRVDRAGTTITIAGNRGTCVLGQTAGDALKRTMTDEQKAALKKRGLRAAVKVRRQGEAVEFLGIEMWIGEST